MLFKSADPAIRVSIELIVGLAVVAAAVVAFLATMVLRAHRQRAATGREGMVSERGVARTDLVAARQGLGARRDLGRGV